MLKEGGITSYGTDFRTFGENEKGIRVSGYPMNKPNGIEIRIFDNFDSKYLRNLLFFLFLMIENSFQKKQKIMYIKIKHGLRIFVKL